MPMTWKRPLKRLCAALALASATPLLAATDAAAPDPLLDAARQAHQRRDAARLAPLAAQALAAQHPLAAWFDYWQHSLRVAGLDLDAFRAFAQRWPGSYPEDRLRNDWLLERGRSGDWVAFAAEYPRFRMDDDRELHCHALRAERQLGRPLREAADAAPFKERALAAWLASREADPGCHALAQQLLGERVFGPTELRRKLLRSVEDGRARAFLQAAALSPAAKALGAAWSDPARFLKRSGKGAAPEPLAIALARLAAADPGRAAAQLAALPAQRLGAPLQQWTLLQLTRQAALRQQPEAAEHLRAALALRGAPAPATWGEWGDETRAWAARAALRAGDWPLLLRTLQPLSEGLARDSAWTYWRAQAAYRAAPEGASGDTQRREARAALQQLASPLHFYGKLAADELGLRLPLPPAPAPPTAVERQAAAEHAGLGRALLLIRSGLRGEGVREWNFSLRDFAGDDRLLLAAAQRACAMEVWDRCINTSERTQLQIDLAQRYPMPYREQVVAQARAVGLDPADPFGLMRQESRFISDARSHVGASGLMQVMPSTARWTARKLGLAYSPGALQELDFNLRIGMAYLRMVMDDFDGALPLAAAAYNAGPGRPRRWREGAPLDAAAWAETIPFNETRDYVKKVLSNATVYARLLGAEDVRLRQRLGTMVGPRSSGRPINEDLP